MHRDFEKPAYTSIDICKPHGLVELNVRYASSVPVRAPPQSPESAIVHEVIAQFETSVLEKNTSQVVNPVEGVIFTSALPEEYAWVTAVAVPAVKVFEHLEV